MCRELLPVLAIVHWFSYRNYRAYGRRTERLANEPDHRNERAREYVDRTDNVTAQPRNLRWTDRLPKSLMSISGSIIALTVIGSAIVWVSRVDGVITSQIEARACSPAKTDTLIHQHVDPIIDSLSVLNRKMLKQAIYQTVQMDEMLGPARARVAEMKYLAIIKAMEGNR